MICKYQLFWKKAGQLIEARLLLLQQSCLLDELTGHSSMKTLTFLDSDYPELSQDLR